MADCTHSSNGWVPLHVCEKSLNHAHSRCKVKHAGTSKELRTISQTVHACRIDCKPRPWEVLSAGSARMSVPLRHQSNSDRYRHCPQKKYALKETEWSQRQNTHKSSSQKAKPFAERQRRAANKRTHSISQEAMMYSVLPKASALATTPSTLVAWQK